MLRPVHDDDLPIFFEQERDPEARHMAAFVPDDPDDRDAFEAQWRKMRASDAIRVRTIVVDGGVDVKFPYMPLSTDVKIPYE